VTEDDSAATEHAITNAHDFPARVRRALSVHRAVKIKDESLYSASVLLPFFASESGAPYLWLVRRAIDMRLHGGQVALPGGRRDERDPDLLTTALRETHEEIGLLPSAVDVLGVLDDYVTITGFAVTPYVGWIAKPFEPRPRASEVARVFAAPLLAFERPPRAMSVGWGDSKRIVLSYEAEGEIVWGATASILRGFFDLMGCSGSAASSSDASSQKA
jgi:8-oxo-dGTP pyrophosphatase MutT (NUDIX family)